MNIEFREAKLEDAALLVEIKDASFYSDFVKYGECPGYGNTVEMMEKSIVDYPKFIIMCDDVPVGCISCTKLSEGEYEVGCLCVIPEYQGRGIGRSAMEYVFPYYSDWEKITLVTPADKEENVKFYTEKCGFDIEDTEKDGSVRLYRFLKCRNM